MFGLPSADALRQAGFKGFNQPSGIKPDVAQMPVSEETKAMLEQHGHPQFATHGELNSYLNKLQQDNPGRYNQLFDAMHPGLRGQTP